MAESNGQSNSEPPICPCGFFGRAETMGMCSKCYKDYLDRKTAEASGASSPPTSSVTTEPDNRSALGTSHLDQVTPNIQDYSSQSNAPQNLVIPAQSPSTASNSSSEPSSASLGDSNKPSPSSNSPTSSAVKRSREPSESENVEEAEGSAKKNKKRCFQCNVKLPPAIREIGRCRCDKIFCQLHRLPEQHNCDFDHKEKGRQEAREKMVPAKRHIGNALKRIDSDHQ